MFGDVMEKTEHKLLDEISNYLGLRRYFDESEESYINRLLYSAVGETLLVSTLKKSSLQPIGGVSKTQQFQIVGVDEADLKLGKIAFTSPLARLLIHHKAGDSVTLKLAHGDKIFKILAIT